MKYNPEEDGITHINIYSKGKTSLGRKLSNWYPGTYKYLKISLGNFHTIEGLIFFLGCFDNRLRETTGYESKKLGEELDRKIRLPEEIFKNYIIEAMKEKINQSEKTFGELYENLKYSELPLVHYYNYGGKVIISDKWQWQIEEWEKIRKEIKNA